MMLWFVLALMTAVAMFSVLWPLARRTPLRTGTDVEVYRDQLDEIGRDRSAGLIGEREAEAARIEVSRRLIAAADAAKPAPAAGGQWRRRAAAVVALGLLPLGVASLYLALGSPQLPGAAAGRAARAVAGAPLDCGIGGPGRSPSRTESGGRPRLGGDRAGLHAARPLRRRGEGAAQRAAAARSERRTRGRPRRGAHRRGRRCRHRRGQGGLRARDWP